MCLLKFPGEIRTSKDKFNIGLYIKCEYTGYYFRLPLLYECRPETPGPKLWPGSTDLGFVQQPMKDHVGLAKLPGDKQA